MRRETGWRGALQNSGGAADMASWLLARKKALTKLNRKRNCLENFIGPIFPFCHSLTNALETWMMWVWLMRMEHSKLVGDLAFRLKLRLTTTDTWNWNWVKIWKLKFGRAFNAQFLSWFRKLKQCPNSEGKVWLRFWSWYVVNVLRLKFAWDFEAENYSRSWNLNFVEIDERNDKAYTLLRTFNPWVCCTFGNVNILVPPSSWKLPTEQVSLMFLKFMWQT